MPPRLIVLNEWIFSDLWKENGTERQNESLRFLQKFVAVDNSDKLVFLKGSAWADKANQLSTWLSKGRNDKSREAIKTLFFGNILQNQNKTELLSQTDSLPSDIKAKFEPSMESDFYLLETYLTAKADLLITTDVKLRERICEIPELEIRAELRDDFLERYLRQS